MIKWLFNKVLGTINDSHPLAMHISYEHMADLNIISYEVFNMLLDYIPIDLSNDRYRLSAHSTPFDKSLLLDKLEDSGYNIQGLLNFVYSTSKRYPS